MFEKKEWHETATLLGTDLPLFVQTMRKHRVRFYFTPYQYELGGVAYSGKVFTTKKRFVKLYSHFLDLRDRNDKMLAKYSSNGMI